MRNPVCSREKVFVVALGLAVCLSLSCDEPGNIGLGSIEYTCGNDKIENQEVCDGTELVGNSCRDMAVPDRPGQFFLRGQLACAADCKSYDFSGCEGFCGDGVMDTPGSGGEESCDGSDFGGRMCSDFVVPQKPGEVFYRGLLECSPDCSSILVDHCSGYCGDSIVDHDGLQSPEVCDGPNLGTGSCQGLSIVDSPGSVYYWGTPECAADCRSFAVGSCRGYCGDGIIQSDAPGGEEVCDRANLNGVTCSDVLVPGHADRYYYAGTPGCNSDCKSINKGSCYGYCGNGELEPDGNGVMEVCDRDSVGGASCEDVGCLAGTPDCVGCATFDYSECHKCCGDDICESGEDACDCPECYVERASHSCEGDSFVTLDSCGKTVDSEYCACGCDAFGCQPDDCCLVTNTATVEVDNNYWIGVYFHSNKTCNYCQIFESLDLGFCGSSADCGAPDGYVEPYTSQEFEVPAGVELVMGFWGCDFDMLGSQWVICTNPMNCVNLEPCETFTLTVGPPAMCYHETEDCTTEGCSFPRSLSPEIETVMGIGNGGSAE